jgi:DNA-binding NarL/FixJ family response regulator
MTCVLLVSTQALLRETLARVLSEEEPSFAMVKAGSGEEALELAALNKPDLIVLHFSNPVSSAFRSLYHLRAEYPDTRVVALLDVVDDSMMRLAIEAGAHGFIDGSVSLPRLLQDLKDAAKGELSLSNGLVRLVAAALKPNNGGSNGNGGYRNGFDTPTPRECRVLELLSLGLTNGAIASRLMLSESTVRAHVRAISQKLGAQNRVEAVAKALARGIISCESERASAFNGEA